MLNHRKAYLVGALCGVAVAGAAATMIGMGEQPGGGDMRLTSSADGRTAYLWSVGGGKLTFIDSARAPKGHGEEDEHGKPEEKGKGEKDDKGKGKGKG